MVGGAVYKSPSCLFSILLLCITMYYYYYVLLCITITMYYCVLLCITITMYYYALLLLCITINTYLELCNLMCLDICYVHVFCVYYSMLLFALPSCHYPLLCTVYDLTFTGLSFHGFRGSAAICESFILRNFRPVW